jgi:hypothetical protein
VAEQALEKAMPPCPAIPLSPLVPDSVAAFHPPAPAVEVAFVVMSVAAVPVILVDAVAFPPFVEIVVPQPLPPPPAVAVVEAVKDVSSFELD